MKGKTEILIKKGIANYWVSILYELHKRQIGEIHSVVVESQNVFGKAIVVFSADLEPVTITGDSILFKDYKDAAHQGLEQFKKEV